MPEHPAERESRPAISPAEAPEEMRPALEKALNGLPEDKREEILSIVRFRFRFFQGPLPPPDELKSYEEARPGCAGQIIDWADRSLAHEHEAERRRQQTDDKLLLRGQAASFALALAALLCGFGAGFWLMTDGHVWRGLACAGAFTGVSVLFVKSEALFRLLTGDRE